MNWIDYESPHSVREAVDLLNEAGDRAKPMAGGTDLLVQLRAGRWNADIVVDVKNIPDLNEITYDPEQGLTLGAAVPCYRIYGNNAITNAYPGLIDCASLIGGTQIQGRASLGGNLCNSTPSADSIPAMIALGATAKRKAYDDAQYDPTMPPVDPSHLSGADHGIMMHADAVDLQPAFAGQRVVDRQHDRLSRAEPRLDDLENGQSKFIQTPLGLGKQTMEAGVVFAAHGIGRHNRAGDRVPPRKHPTGQEGDESVEGRRGHDESKLLDKFQKRRYESHCEPPCSFGPPSASMRMAVIVHRPNRLDGSFLFTRRSQNDSEKCETRTNSLLEVDLEVTIRRLYSRPSDRHKGIRTYLHHEYRGWIPLF